MPRNPATRPEAISLILKPFGLLIWLGFARLGQPVWQVSRGEARCRFVYSKNKAFFLGNLLKTKMITSMALADAHSGLSCSFCGPAGADVCFHVCAGLRVVAELLHPGWPYLSPACAFLRPMCPRGSRISNSTTARSPAAASPDYYAYTPASRDAFLRIDVERDKSPLPDAVVGVVVHRGRQARCGTVS